MTQPVLSQPLESVAGTTFRIQPSLEAFDAEPFVIDHRGGQAIYAKVVDALIIPEPTNPYDPDAKKVCAYLADGQLATIGYLAKAGQLYQTIQTQTPCQLRISDYKAQNAKNRNGYKIIMNK